MSNNDEYSDGLGPEYWANLKKAREENEQNIQKKDALDQAQGPKPTIDAIGKEPMTDQQLHDVAKQSTQAEQENTRKLKEGGLLEPTPDERRAAHEQADQQKSQDTDQSQSHGYRDAREVRQERRDQSKRRGR